MSENLLPDVVGLLLEDGRKLLEQKGYNIERVSITTVPHSNRPLDEKQARIIRVDQLDLSKVNLLVCCIHDIIR